MEQIVDGLGKIVEGINSVDAALNSNRVNEIIYVKINQKIRLNLLYDNNRSLQKKIKLEQLKREIN